MAAVTICSDFGAQNIKSATVSTVSPSICHEVMGPDAMILVFWMLSFKPTFSLSSFTFIKRLFSSFSLSAIRVVSSAYLSLLIFLPAFLTQAVLHPVQCFSWCTLHKQGDNTQPWHTPFSIWKRSEWVSEFFFFFFFTFISILLNESPLLASSAGHSDVFLFHSVLHWSTSTAWSWNPWFCWVVRIGNRSPEWPWRKDKEGKSPESRTKEGPRTRVSTSGRINSTPGWPNLHKAGPGGGKTYKKSQRAEDLSLPHVCALCLSLCFSLSLLFLSFGSACPHTLRMYFPAIF